MIGGRRPRRALAAAVSGAVVLAGVLVAGPAARVGADPNLLRFADGTWHGTVVYSAAGEFGSGVTAQGALQHATFEADVNGGSVTGTFTASGEGSSQVPGGSATLTASFDGLMAGTSDAPVIDPQSASFSGTATVNGLTVPVNLSFGAGDLNDVPLTITAATCGQVNGNFVQPVQAAIGGAGGTLTSLTANFFAVRTALSGDAAQALQDLLSAAQQISDQFAATGELDSAGLVEVVAKAEAFSASLAKASSCGLKGAGTFSDALTGIVAHMLDLAITSPDKLSTTQLTDLLWWGTQVGAIGEGAIDEAFSQKILGNAENILTDRLNAAIAAGDKDTITDVYIAALTMGWNDLLQQAAAAGGGSP